MWALAIFVRVPPHSSKSCWAWVVSSSLVITCWGPSKGRGCVKGSAVVQHERKATQALISHFALRESMSSPQSIAATAAAAQLMTVILSSTTIENMLSYDPWLVCTLRPAALLPPIISFLLSLGEMLDQTCQQQYSSFFEDSNYVIKDDTFFRDDKCDGPRITWELKKLLLDAYKSRYTWQPEVDLL